MVTSLREPSLWVWTLSVISTLFPDELPWQFLFMISQFVSNFFTNGRPGGAPTIITAQKKYKNSFNSNMIEYFYKGYDWIFYKGYTWTHK